MNRRACGGCSTRRVFLLLALALPAAATAQPLLPDLGVTYIEFNPKYPAYQAEYGPADRNPRESEASLAHEKHWPDEGEMLAITGYVMNHGFVPSAPTECLWSLDGVALGEPIPLPALEPGDQALVELRWPWEPVQHELTLRVETGDDDEISAANDELTVHTYALNLVVVCAPRTYTEFSRVENLLGSYSWEDWINEHILHMNPLFRDAVYPVTPDGVDERVRIDRMWLGTREERDERYGSPSRSLRACTSTGRVCWPPMRPLVGSAPMVRT